MNPELWKVILEDGSHVWAFVAGVCPGFATDDVTLVNFLERFKFGIPFDIDNFQSKTKSEFVEFAATHPILSKLPAWDLLLATKSTNNVQSEPDS